MLDPGFHKSFSLTLTFSSHSTGLKGGALSTRCPQASLDDSCLNLPIPLETALKKEQIFLSSLLYNPTYVKQSIVPGSGILDIAELDSESSLKGLDKAQTMWRPQKAGLGSSSAVIDAVYH